MDRVWCVTSHLEWGVDLLGSVIIVAANWLYCIYKPEREPTPLWLVEQMGFIRLTVLIRDILQKLNL